MLACNAAEAQGNARADIGNFSGLIRVGANTSQIHGDGYGGYNKVNLTGGVGVSTPFKKDLKLQFEINYAGRGSRKRPLSWDPSVYRISAHYIDLPILVRFSYWKLEFEAGICNGIYVWHNEFDGFGKVPENVELYRFNRYELAANAGAYARLWGNWLANVRFHYSILPATGGLVRGNNSLFFVGVKHNVISLCLVRNFKAN
ncbi:MAG: hypothetical protein Kow0075_07130 [Salibacteraceae bacterium]